MQTQPISFAIPAAQFEALRRRAGTLNLRPAEYARRLFDAAYFVRVTAEKGEQPEDTELDRKVREVFLLADCEPDYIAEALRMPPALAQKILDGWRQAARDMIDPPARPAPAAPPARSVDAKPRAGSYSPEEISVIRAMWREGKSMKVIAETIGRPFAGFTQWTIKHRDICPARRGG